MACTSMKWLFKLYTLLDIQRHIKIRRSQVSRMLHVIKNNEFITVIVMVFLLVSTTHVVCLPSNWRGFLEVRLSKEKVNHNWTPLRTL